MNERDVALKPKTLNMEEAASIPLVGLTAWQALIERAHLKKRQKVFTQAGSGGVGRFAVQLAKHIGATVATTTSTANVELVESLGADVVIDYKKQQNAVLPSIIDTAANRASMPNADPAKWVAPKELADVILFLASDAASAVTGALLPVNGRV